MDALTYAIVGDIGGTNARFAIVETDCVQLQHIKIFQCSEYASIADAIKEYYEWLPEHISESDIEHACFAFACPVHEDRISMTNNPWSFTKAELQEWLGVSALKILNDFTAMAMSVPHIPENDLTMVCEGVGHKIDEDNRQPRLIVGAGTGLGVSALVDAGMGWFPLATEGGHVEFAPVDEFEIEIWRILNERFGRVSVERILSGEGIYNLYQAMAIIQDKELRFAKPSEITEAALQGDAFCKDVILRFCNILGRFAGNTALTVGALGGVYISGGVVPRFLDLLLESDYQEAFVAKGRMRSVLEDVPCYVVTDSYAGLRGVAVALYHPGIKNISLSRN